MERKYKDQANKVHQISDEFKHLLPPGCVEITDAEAAALLRPLGIVKAEKLAALDADRKRIENLPIQGNNGGVLFKISRPEKVNEFLMGGIQIALDPSPAAKFSMLDDDGVAVEYTKVLMGQIIGFINSSKSPALARYAGRKAAIEAAASIAEAEAVNTNLMEA